MEAIITRASGKHPGAAAPRWLLEARNIGGTVLGAIGYVLVHYSRAAMLLRGGSRPFRRL